MRAAGRPDDVVARFAIGGEVAAVEPFSGGGHINESHVVTCRGSRDRPARRARPARFFLQLLNPDVFPDPHRLMENVARVTRHLDGPLRLVPTLEGAAFFEDDRGGVWRLYGFIEHAVTRAEPTGPGDAERASRAFGAFQRSLVDLPGPRLHETIPHFHDTPCRVDALEHAVQCDAAQRASGARPEIAQVRARSGLAQILVQAAARGAVPERIVHNDAKLANVLFDASGEALCVVDLDTVMPGLGLYDFGDLVRSMATRAAEDERDLGRVRLEPELFEAIARGYLAGTGDLLTRAERELLVAGAQVIVFEQAVRFLIDHLEGDRYYRVARPGHGLDRCRTQLALLASLLEQERALQRIIERL
ncbi:MAG TPA: aminoglycoside phosphotransferase family protein [Gemmatimonadales bacterium]|jgi:aminoglycoside phosphotransferase (APT) family kinase protein|nr:aminoglycoside phosphotransferase family protein [Gemmatimonadales bacterium]